MPTSKFFQQIFASFLTLKNNSRLPLLSRHGKRIANKVMVELKCRMRWKDNRHDEICIQSTLRIQTHSQAMTSSSYIKGETTYKYSTKEGGWFLCETTLIKCLSCDFISILFIECCMHLYIGSRDCIGCILVRKNSCTMSLNFYRQFSSIQCRISKQ